MRREIEEQSPKEGNKENQVRISVGKNRKNSQDKFLSPRATRPLSSLAPFPGLEAHHHLALVLLVGLEELVDHIGCEEDRGALLERPDEIREDREGSDTHASEGGGRGDIAVELLAQDLSCRAGWSGWVRKERERGKSLDWEVWEELGELEDFVGTRV